MEAPLRPLGDGRRVERGQRGSTSWLTATISDPGEFGAVHTTGRLCLKPVATRLAIGRKEANVRRNAASKVKKRIFGGDALMDTEGEFEYEGTAGWGCYGTCREQSPTAK